MELARELILNTDIWAQSGTERWDFLSGTWRYSGTSAGTHAVPTDIKTDNHRHSSNFCMVF